MEKKLAKGASRDLKDASMASQDAPRARPRRLQDASQAASNLFESELASYFAFGTPKLLPNGFQNRSKGLPERIL